MRILTALRERVSGREPSAAAPAGEGQPAVEAPLPASGYDRLKTREVLDGLHNRSQVELEAVENYERSHQNRGPVLDKLRYMRGPEPMPGYDALEIEAVVAALDTADLATIKKIRSYERKFANRAAVLEAAVEAQHRSQAAQPVTAPPSYQPLGGASV